MSAMKAFSACVRCTSPADSEDHSAWVKMRGIRSKGMMRSAASSSPYTAKVMPSSRKYRSAASARPASAEEGVSRSHWASGSSPSRPELASGLDP